MAPERVTFKEHRKEPVAKSEARGKGELGERASMKGRCDVVCPLVLCVIGMNKG